MSIVPQIDPTRTDRDWSRAPIYASRDLHAAEVNGYERGRTDGYLDGYADGKAGAAVEADAEAVAFAELVKRATRGTPHVEIVRRRAEASGHPEVFAAQLATAQAHHDRVHQPVTTDLRRAA